MPSLDSPAPRNARVLPGGITVRNRDHSDDRECGIRFVPVVEAAFVFDPATEDVLTIAIEGTLPDDEFRCFLYIFGDHRPGCDLDIFVPTSADTVRRLHAALGAAIDAAVQRGILPPVEGPVS